MILKDVMGVQEAELQVANMSIEKNREEKGLGKEMSPKGI